MSKFLESQQYNYLSATSAMLLSQSKTLNLMSNSSNKKCNSSLNNTLKQKQTRIFIDDSVDYTFVSYNNNASIQTSSVEQPTFVLTKTVLRFLELINLALINPNYTLDWITYDLVDGTIKTINQTSSPVSPFNIQIDTSITLTDGTIQEESNNNYYINNKSTSCIVSFLSSFGILGT
jgi:hypothetical protein